MTVLACGLQDKIFAAKSDLGRIVNIRFIFWAAVNGADMYFPRASVKRYLLHSVL